MTEPLKPCPCGSKAELHEDIAMSGKGQFWVQSEAGWVGPTKSGPDDAVDAWNTRPASPAPVWRDMDSAPKDGTEVLGRHHKHEKRIRLMWYFKASSMTQMWRDENGNEFKPDAWAPLPHAPGSQPTEQPPQEKRLSRNQPCGCVVCHCEDDEQCQGCGAKSCGNHPVGEIPNPVYEQPPQAVVQVDKSTGEICTPPIRSTDANGDELVTFTSANTLADIARWIAENQTDAEEVIRILTDMTTVRALAGEEG